MLYFEKTNFDFYMWSYITALITRFRKIKVISIEAKQKRKLAVCGVELIIGSQE